MNVRTFAVVYDTATNAIKRLIDTSDDPDDSHLERVKKYLAQEETMEIFRQDDFPIKYPRFVAPFLGQGAVVDKLNARVTVDASQLKDISVDAKAFANQQIAIERQAPKPGPPYKAAAIDAVAK